VSMDRNRELFVAAFPYEDGRTLFVLKEPRRCRRCGLEVKLVVETPTDMPVCVPCAESRRLEAAGVKQSTLEVTGCSACKSDHRIPPWGISRAPEHAPNARRFHCPNTGVDVFILPTP
jgi:hypothetical protein